MTLRDDVRATLGGDGTDAFDALGDMASELVGTALGHFADTSTLADADALAPIVTAASPVPFDPLLDGVGTAPEVGVTAGEDPDGFDRVDDESISDESGDEDPGVFDDVADSTDVETDTEIEEPAIATATEEVNEFETPDSAFGSGDAANEPVVESDDLFEGAAPVAEPMFAEQVEFDAVGSEIRDEPAADFDPIDVDDFDVDPADGDFDIID